MRFFFNSFAKTISPDSGHFVQTPLGTPSLAFTLTVEYFGFPKNAINQKIKFYP